MNMNILVVDDDEVLRRNLSEWLQRDGYNVESAGSGEEAVEMVKKHEYKLVFTDLKMPGMGGMGVLKAIKQLNPDIHMVMITAYGTIDTAVEAMKIGAEDYITKPFKMEQLRTAIENITKAEEFETQIRKMFVPEETKSQDPFELLISMVPNNSGLCITCQSPEVIKKKYNLQDITILWLTTEARCDSCIHPKKINDLKAAINNFLEENPKGIVLLDGLEIIIEYHSSDVVKKFIIDVLDETLKKPSHLIIPVNTDQIDEDFFAELKHLISYPYIQQISESLSSPIRRETVRFLSDHSRSSFTEIQNELELKEAPKLSFHLKRLANEGILQKSEKKGYSLTNRGETAAEYLLALENKVTFNIQKKVSLLLKS